MQIIVLGAGEWGSAVALYLSKLGHAVTLGARDAALVAQINNDGASPEYLPGVSLRGVASATLDQLPSAADIVIVAAPSHAFSEMLSAVKVESPVWISLAKGIMLDTLSTPCEALEKLRPNAQVLTLAGPTHALSVAQGLPCAMVLAGAGDLETLRAALSGSAVRVYSSSDRRGAELGGALKNSFAVAAGVCDGLKLGDNAKAGLLTRALSEMSRLGVALGGRAETFFGLTGAGDLMATSYGVWSRNRTLGERVARGSSPEQLMAEGLTAEGYRAAKGLLALARQKSVPAPILEQVVAVLYEKKDPKVALLELMNRPLKCE